MANIQRPFIVADGGTGATTASGAQTNLGVPASTAVMLLSGTQSMAASLNMGTNQIINVTDPTTAQMAATKNYVDNAVAGISASSRTSVRVATAGSNITSLSSGAPNTLDGISLNANDYILVKDQTTQSQNGVYSVTTVGTGSNGVWARATGDNTSAEIIDGLYCFVGQGTTNAGSVWMLSADEPFTLGTTSLTFIQVNGAFDITAGSGLQKSGNTISVLAANSTVTVNGSGIAVSSTYAGNSSLTTVGTISTGTWNGTSIGVGYGGTGAATASAARTNLSAAPNTPSYWIGATNSELANGLVPSGGTGILVTSTTGVIAVDTTVVATISNTVTLSNKTLNSPIINYPVKAKTGDYTSVVGDAGTITFNITAGHTLTLPASGTLTSGWTVTVKNKAASTANVSVKTQGSDTGENGTITSSVSYEPLTPGTSIDFQWDGSEFIAL